MLGESAYVKDFGLAQECTCHFLSVRHPSHTGGYATLKDQQSSLRVGKKTRLLRE
jgi:hypothetical protein